MNETTANIASTLPKVERNSDPGQGYRVVILMNQKLEGGIVLNAIAHLGMGIAHAVGEEGRRQLKFLDFTDGNGQAHKSISARSLIVLRGKLSELRKLREQARDAGILAVDFTSSMTGDTYREQLERTAQIPEPGLEYYGVALFGPVDKISPLTKRYSLWK